MIPIPYYQNEDVWCESFPPQLCSPLGWHLKPSIWGNITNKSGQTVSHTIKTPQNAEEYCSLNLKSKTGVPVGLIEDCGDYKIVSYYGCFDCAATVLDKNWNEIEKCGGFFNVTESKRCREKYPVEETCIATSCIK